VTPLDVVKIRLQAQQKEFMRNKCYLYCNGLMEHICYCPYGNNNTIAGKKIRKNRHSYHSVSVASIAQNNIDERWFRRHVHFTGTMVCFTYSMFITFLII